MLLSTKLRLLNSSSQDKNHCYNTPSPASTHKQFKLSLIPTHVASEAKDPSLILNSGVKA